jgi:sugar lactone lactonase YvrE
MRYLKHRILLFAAALGFLSPVAFAAETYTFTTLAGSSGSVINSIDATGSAAQFSAPRGVAVDSAGNLYIADSGNNTIRKVTATGVTTTIAGIAGTAGAATATPAKFNEPFGVAVDSAGTVYVADTNNGVIRKITSAGVVSNFAGGNGPGYADGTGTAAKFHEPHGIAVDTSGNVFVADYENNVVRKITAAGVVTTLAGTYNTPGSTDGQGAEARFMSLQGLAVDSTGNVFVVDAGNRAIRKITPSGLVTTFVGGASSQQFRQPSGLTIDASGNLYLTDASAHVIYKVTTAGAVTKISGTVPTPGSTDGTTGALFNAPAGITVDSANNLYVADTSNNTIRKITATGTVTTLAGLAGRTSSVDGSGTVARFEDPYALAVDAAGNVYVADATDHSIRKIANDGTTTTLAGKGGSFGSTDGTGTAARFHGPLGIAVDSTGTVYVADTGNELIRKVGADGTVTTITGTESNGTKAHFSGPYGITVDGAGNIYVIESTGALRKITAGGTVTTLAGATGSNGLVDGTGTAARFSVPFDIAVDGAGNLYVSDHGNHAVRKITAAGVVTTLAGSGSMGNTDATGTAASFKFPSGIAADSAGNVYLADTDNQVIRKITPAGAVTTIAGGSIGSANGVGTAALFYNPKDVAVDSSGNLYIADRGNHTIRKGTLQSGTGTTPTTTNASDCLFNWAEKNYASLFSPVAQSAEADLGPFHYRYRYYTSTRMYLATSSDGNVYYMGPNDAKPVNANALTYWLGQAGCP